MRLRTLLKRDESYAIHALLLLAEEPGLSAAEIAAKLKAPPAFMAKVLSKLAKAGLVESRMGRAGGVRLKALPEEITLLKVMEGDGNSLGHCDPGSLCYLKAVSHRGKARVLLSKAKPGAYEPGNPLSSLGTKPEGSPGRFP